MNCLVIKSNHGNHSGFNRKWEILKEFKDLRDGSDFLSMLKEELTGEGKFGVTSFEDDLIYYYLINEDDFDIFDGGHFGYASKEIKEFFNWE